MTFVTALRNDGFGAHPYFKCVVAEKTVEGRHDLVIYLVKNCLFLSRFLVYVVVYNLHNFASPMNPSHLPQACVSLGSGLGVFLYLCIGKLNPLHVSYFNHIPYLISYILCTACCQGYLGSNLRSCFQAVSIYEDPPGKCHDRLQQVHKQTKTLTSSL